MFEPSEMNATVCKQGAYSAEAKAKEGTKAEASANRSNTCQGVPDTSPDRRLCNPHNTAHRPKRLM